MSTWQPYIIACFTGLLIGIERERAQPNEKVMGIRTFFLISLLGAIAGGLQAQWFAALLAGFSLSLILISYFTQTYSVKPGIDRGLTTEFAAGIVFSLAYAAHESPALSATIGPLVAITLFSKAKLSRFTRSIRQSELEAALLLVLGGVVIVNVVPDSTIDPFGVFNPRKFGYLILTLATLEFSSYVLVKLFGERAGSLVVGFLGGLASSTAVLLSSARKAKADPGAWRPLLCAALAAKLAAIVELFFIIGVISPALLLQILPVAGAGLLAGVLGLLLVSWKMERRAAKLALRSPLDWPGVFRLSVLLGAILASISLAKLWLGDRGTFVVSFLTGLFELHGVSLANATLFSQEKISIGAAGISIALALVASLLAKISICWVIDRGTFARVLTAVFLPMVAATAVAALFSFK